MKFKLIALCLEKLSKIKTPAFEPGLHIYTPDAMPLKLAAFQAMGYKPRQDIKHYAPAVSGLLY